MSPSPHIFFMAMPGQLQERFWTAQAQERARELGFEVRLNALPGKLRTGEWVEQLVGVEALLTTWGSPRIDATVLLQNQTLKIIGHVGGSLAGIVSAALFERGVKVCTANRLMARTVAEWSLMMTMVGLRQLLSYAQFGSGGKPIAWPRREGNLPPDEAVIGIWGYGDVARAFIELVRPLRPKEILVHDDFLSEEVAQVEGLSKVGLDELFATADIIHCQTGLTAENKGRVGTEQLTAIKKWGVGQLRARAANRRRRADCGTARAALYGDYGRLRRRAIARRASLSDHAQCDFDAALRGQWPRRSLSGADAR